MGASVSRWPGRRCGTVARRVTGSGSGEDKQPIVEEQDHKRRRSSCRRDSCGETLDCPTCRGTGRIPRGQENKLVAVIPCNDQRLRPRHTKLYMAVSVAVCLLVSSLVLFFLFPRAVMLSPVAVKSVLVYYSPDTVLLDVTNVLNISNQNFVVVHAYNLTVQALNFETVVGSVTIQNVTTVHALSNKMFSFHIPIKLTDEGLNTYCRSKAIPIHTLFIHLQMSVTVCYLVHSEQLSVDTYEYIDCGANVTTPHLVQAPRP